MTSCPRCEAERMRADAIENDLHLAQEEIVRQRRVIQALKQREVIDAEEHDARDPDVRTALEHWIKATNRTPRTNVKAGSDRWVFMKRQLEKRSLEQVLKAIDGIARVPYVGDRGRQSTPVEGKPRGGRADELSTIFRSDETVDRACGYAVDERLAFEVERWRTCGVREDRAYEIMHLRSCVEGAERFAAWVWDMATQEDRDRLLGELSALHRLERFQEAQVEVAERRLRLVKDEEAA